MGRGGDQVPFLQKGYPAIRFSVGVEDYDHQHQDLRTEDGVFYGDTVEEMDFAYLAGVTKLNVRALDALARAPMPPKVSVDAAVRTDTELEFEVPLGSDRSLLQIRRTDAPDWMLPGEADERINERSVRVEIDENGVTRMTVPVRGDDWMFGVAACAGNWCSPVSSAVPGGAFEPVAKD